MGKRQRFTKEFKQEALRLWKGSGRPAAAVARKLGLRRNHLYKWAKKLGSESNFSDLSSFGTTTFSDDALSRRTRGWGQVACWPNFPIAGWEAEE